MNKSLLTLCWLVLAINQTATALEVGELPPGCQASLINSNSSIEFSTHKNQVLLVDFWATWCAPCKKSMPFFNHLHSELSKKGFEIIAINVDEDSKLTSEYLKDNPVSYPIATDPSGNCPKAFEVKAMPSSFLIDKSGKIRYIHLGFRDEDQVELRAKIEALLAETH